MSFYLGDSLKLRLIPTVSGPLTEAYYRVSAVTTVQELLNLSVPVYRKIFLPYGYTLEEYDLVSREDVVYSLVNASNVSFNVPAKLVEEVYEDPLVTYESKTLAISLGEHPSYRNFTALISYLEEAISEYIGVTPAIKLLTTSAPIRITEERHLYLTALRENISATIRTPSRRLVQREEELEVLTLRYKALEDYILNYLGQCAEDCGAGEIELPTDPYSSTTIDKAAFSFSISNHNLLRNPCGLNHF